MKKFKVSFSKLIGNHYNYEQKMIILDWMIKTGKPHTKYIGRWHNVGITKLLFDYSANECSNFEFSLPKNSDSFNDFFDSIFARAVYKEVDKPLKIWREKENVIQGKSRMLSFTENYPKFFTEKHGYFNWMISSIFRLNGELLSKEHHHKNYKERVNPKIIWIKIFTLGNGWKVQYGFSFENFNYENGWQKEYQQKQNQSLWEFFGEVYEDITNNRLKNLNEKN